jgi:hypothetical protein
VKPIRAALCLMLACLVGALWATAFWAFRLADEVLDAWQNRGHG